MDVAEGMSYLHQTMHCCHRDLKSPNILLTGNVGTTIHAKIADFGMSKIVVSDAQTRVYNKQGDLPLFKGTQARYGGRTFDGAGNKTASSKITSDASLNGFWTTTVGTLEWLAPELMRAASIKKKSHYTDTVDQYAFGCIMYECLELRPPWSHDKKYKWSENIYDAIMSGLRPPHTKWSSSGYCELMKLCWAQIPSRRPGFDVIIKKLNRIQSRSRGRAPKHSLSGVIRSVVRGAQNIEAVSPPASPSSKNNSDEDEEEQVGGAIRRPSLLPLIRESINEYAS